ncbi:hypothetical protein Hanom_Chr10g00878441 [Helianthus anomalus]
MEKLQVLFFIFISCFRRCPFQRISISFALYKEFCCTFCPLTLTSLDFLVKFGHAQVNEGSLVFIHIKDNFCKY